MTLLHPAFAALTLHSAILSRAQTRPAARPLRQGSRFINQQRRTTVRSRRRQVCRCSADSGRLPSSVASVKDKSTDAAVYIVGCVHGSRVSAEDVTKVLDHVSPDAVILELCDSRLETLRAMLSNTSARRRLSEGFQARKRKSFAQMSTAFGGAGPAAVAFVLESVYRLQVLSGVDPGIEFVEPIRRYLPSQIVCGDAPARDTVKHLYSVFVAPLKSLADCTASIRDLLGRVVFPPRGGINMAAVFLGDFARVLELVRLVIPVTAVSVIVSLVGNAGALALESTPIISGLNEGSTGAVFPLVWSILQTIGVSYAIVSTLHFMKVLIADRDRVLARSILDTAAKLRREGNETVTVCAVVGLLHVNGILRLLQERNESM